ncbi:MAG: nuclear transport factor 2 family protein [Lewinellaceae bacterium]|nr:nuclear transport factor 2 family protein [Lewinellaceae bacterium]
MKNILLLAALVSATITLQAQSVNDEADMQAFARNFMNAYNQGDHEAIRKMYTDDAVRIDQEGRQIKGADNIAAYFADQFVKNNATVFIRQLSVSWSDREYTWVASGAYEVNGKTNVYDIPIHTTGAYANAMLKKDGQWKIARSILSPWSTPTPGWPPMSRCTPTPGIASLTRGAWNCSTKTISPPTWSCTPSRKTSSALRAWRAITKPCFRLSPTSNLPSTTSSERATKLVKHWTFKGRHTGDFFGIPASGNPVEISGSTIVRMSKDGRIAGEQDFMDNMSLLAQLGVVSAPGNMAVVDGLYQSFVKGDVPAVLAVMDANIVWNEAEGFPYADRNPYISPDAVLNGVFARIGAEWEYFNLTDIQLHDMSGNKVLATLRYQAKHKTTGKVIDSQTAHLWTLKDGKIVAFQQYTDTKQAVEAVK